MEMYKLKHLFYKNLLYYLWLFSVVHSKCEFFWKKKTSSRKTCKWYRIYTIDSSFHFKQVKRNRTAKQTDMDANWYEIQWSVLKTLPLEVIIIRNMLHKTINLFPYVSLQNFPDASPLTKKRRGTLWGFGTEPCWVTHQALATW